jgi:hypothetical protein
MPLDASGKSGNLQRCRPEVYFVRCVERLAKNSKHSASDYYSRRACGPQQGQDVECCALRKVGTMLRIRAFPSKWRVSMLRDEQVAVLCDIGQSMAFNGDLTGDLEMLVVEGYVAKDGDLYQLTPKGEKIIEDRGAGLNEA